MNPIYNLLVYVVWFFATFFSVVFFLSLLVYKDRIFERRQGKYRPFVTIIVPAFNEEKKIAKTLRSLKRLSYEKIEFIVMNDGSKDNTSDVVRRNIKGDSRFTFIDNKVNQGKAAVLNEGRRAAKGEVCACMDADSIVEKHMIEKMLPYFEEENVGAVTASVQVYKPKKFLHKIIDLEFTLGLSLFLKIFSFFDCIFVTPGPFSLYKKEALERIGGFNETNIVEDHEIAYRLHEHGYKIRNCIEAKVYTKLPDTFKGIYNQRKRWYSGAILTLFEHRKVPFNKKFGLFGYFIPFHYSLILLGLGLFFASTYLSISRFITETLLYRHNNFNFWKHFAIEFDFLLYNKVNILAITMFGFTLLLMVTGIILTRKRVRERKIGLLGYPFLFFLYQIYWGGSLWAVIRRRKVKWR
ncbi:MAG: glycosyltransferase [Candidatus Woesearchaeota archaeon]